MRNSLGPVLAFLIVVAAQGQQLNAPRAAYIYPAGGRPGATMRVQLGGQFLDGVVRAAVSGDGVRATVVGHDRPLTPRQINDLRTTVQELQPRATIDSTVRQQIARIREQLADAARRNTNPAMAEIVTLEITIAPGADPGARSLRVITPSGLSNPVVFLVGQLPEFGEEVTNTLADTELRITLPATVNGRIVPGDGDRPRAAPRQGQRYLPGDVDRYRFVARKGQHLVVAVSARALMPYLADAVPGWFQATVALLDADGEEVAYSDDYRFQPDPVLHYQVSRDGEYVVEIKDALYRGREDFVYRISIGELPFVTSVFPLGARAGVRTDVEIAGWNLTTTPHTWDPGHDPPGVQQLSVRRGSLLSNTVPFVVDTLPEVLEREPAHGPEPAQRVTLPAIINGRIQAAGDSDSFRFGGRAGDRVVAEIAARHLGSPLDSVLELLDTAGNRLVLADDAADPGIGLITHQADSVLSATLPATGTYVLRVGDLTRKGGPEYAYRLRLSPPRPDFDLWVTPSAINGRGGTHVPIAVYVRRKDGFDGDIALGLTGQAPGFVLGGGVLPAGQASVRLTLTMPPIRTPNPITVNLEGRAVIQGREVVRRAAPADERMQAFLNRHLVPADAVSVMVSGRGRGTPAPMRILGPQPVKIPEGGRARVRVGLPPAILGFETVAFELSSPPEGLALEDVSVTQAGAAFTLTADSSRVTPGLRGNLIITVSGERVPPAAQPTPAARRSRVALGSLPALAFEVVRAP
jgi:hypothetical protein